MTCWLRDAVAAALLVIGLSALASWPAAAVTQSIAEKVAAARAAAAAEQYENALKLAEQALVELRHESSQDVLSAAYIEFDVATYLAQMHRFDDAVPRYDSVLTTLRSQKGPESPEVARVLRDYGVVLVSVGRFGDAEAALGKAISIVGASAAPVDSAGLLSTRAGALIELGRYVEAQDCLDRATALYGSGPEADKSNLALLQPRAELALQEGNTEKARQVAADAAALADRLGDSHSRAIARYVEALVDIRLGQFVEADGVLAQLANLPPAAEQGEALFRANVIYYRGVIFVARGQFVEAEAALMKAREIYKSAVGASHPILARVLHNLALVHQELGDLDKAQAFYGEAVRILSATFGEESVQVANTRLEGIQTDWMAGHYDAAEKSARDSIRIVEQAALPDKRLLATAYMELGMTLKRRNQLEEALPPLLHGIELAEQARGTEALQLTVPLLELAEVRVAQKDWADAMRGIERAEAILRRTGSLTPSMLGRALRLDALVAAGTADYHRALDRLREATALARSRGTLIASGLSDAGEREQKVARSIYLTHVAMCYDLMTKERMDGMTGESFEIAQVAQISTAARAISEANARSVDAAGPLGALVRQRQDLVQRWRDTDRLRNDLLTQSSTSTNDQQLAKANNELNRISTEVATLDTRLTSDFPQYSQLTNPAPSTVSSVQSALADDEALVLQVTDDAASFVWLIGKKEALFVRSDLGEEELTRLVRAIRNSVDLSQRKTPPFDTASAYTLYSRLFGPVNERLSRYHKLVFVADGPMLSLPLGILIDRDVPPPKDDYSIYSGFPWLVTKYTIANAPTVSSFLLLRQRTKEAGPKRPFAGFGDPLVGKNKGRNRGATAQMAFARGMGVDRGLFDLLQPLPETSVELSKIMTALGGSEKDLHLGRGATEEAVKSADLQQVGTIAFATHALLAGEFHGLAEPALILTPPRKPKGTNDGLLTSSEVAELKLNAEWVILSACNTAGPDGTPGADGYSGLTQAFFYAGAHSLLVSHWAVDSDSTVYLTTGTAKHIADSPGIGRAEALQQSMLDLISGKMGIRRSHPAFWGAFVLVGDGGS